MVAVQKSDDENEKLTEVDFETAIDLSGFGLFNLICLLVAIPAKFGEIFETTTMSYILPIAECDLKLTLLNKGVLNAMSYGGMVVSAMMWGFIGDKYGRKKLLIFGYLANMVCVFCSSLSQTFEMLAVFKFLGGFIVNGPGAALFTYITEVHGKKYRSRVLMVMGIIIALSNIAMPCLSLAIFPRDWNFVFFGSFNVHSWQIFLAVCSLPCLISGLLFTLIPESPKFLMAKGRNEEALNLLQNIYHTNTRKPKETYQVKSLVEEVPNTDESSNRYNPNSKDKGILQALRVGFYQVRPMFHKPLLRHSIHVNTMQFLLFFGLNTIRLWLPQLFSSIAEYESLYQNTDGSANICKVLEFNVNKTAAVLEHTGTCESTPDISLDMYINNIIVAFVTMTAFLFAAGVVNLLTPKILLSICLAISGTIGISLYWSTTGLSTLIIVCGFMGATSICTSALMSIVVTLFPTSLRTLAVATAMMFGRLGTFCGNMLFPVLVQLGCYPPFLAIACVLYCATVLSCLLPSSKKTVFI
ncbi:synaptic vesicle glycoprotein 2C-like [Teleopsis dalmanni]|uniref:synaptic vesicle glycoprotein 2C-like n=1 Tax=Teleopsis dalmanni TaxID=139649 RepID=UPI0018CCA0A1|nr:synaptic vesicle glycoprotein 2C-like [Teleopsis dalmanni]